MLQPVPARAPAVESRAHPIDWTVIGLSPFETPDPAVVIGVARAGGVGVLDLGHRRGAAREALALLTRAGRPFAVRVSSHDFLDLVAFSSGTLAVIVSQPDLVAPALALRSADVSNGPSAARILAEVCSLDEARIALAAGAEGLIAKGSEAAGRVLDEQAFVLLQHLVSVFDSPIWLRGGIGLRTAAAAKVGGAVGVVLDGQLALARDASTNDALALALRAFDGSETAIVHGHRVLVRGDRAEALQALGLKGLLNALGTDPDSGAVAIGQDACLARPLADAFGTVGGIISAVRASMFELPALAARLRPLAAGSPLAEEHGTHVPVLQGPMTRVSDRAAFARSVAEGGGLPFLALALMRGPEVQRLLEETAATLGDLPWGVGVLGFVPPELRAEQLAAIDAVRPPFALIAGGRPSQARPLEAHGTRVYLHVPSPGLLDLYLKDGARRFVFEGRECGGHVGPRGSFVLWEQQIDRLLAFDRPKELSVIFAGGIHDARSAAMVATLAAPLAARGIHIGILMGTAYLFTEDAVRGGAIVQGFQDAAIACSHTALVESAPGHATRCAESPFVDLFRAERARLEAEGATKEVTWAALETLNLGRLRIASKGLDRQGADIVGVTEERQRLDGMFMIGQVAALRSEITTVAALHAEVSDGATAWLAGYTSVPDVVIQEPVDIAIVGMACVMPGAAELETFWSNIVLGKNSITDVPATRWNAELYYDPNSMDGTRTPSKVGGFLPEIAFEPLQYGIPPKSLAAIEPVQLLALEVARRALDDAGYAKRAFDRERASVFFGAEAGTDLAAGYGFRSLWPQLLGTLPPELDAVLPVLTEDSFPGVLANVIAGRIANRLDLGGANYTVDAACASSLAAVDVAVKSLRFGESDLAIAGGADLHNTIGDYLLFASVHALSKKGQCRTFDSGADGIALGEGVGAVVLKRLEDAERDGDRVYAVIKGVGASSDGKSLGLTAPRKEGQMRALARAYGRAGLSPNQVGLVEAHGTGTVVGDRTEMATLSEVFVAAGSTVGSVALGSVKSNIGHTKCAAGLAGLIKAALSLHHGVLPPTLHMESPNPYWKASESPFAFYSQARPWLSRRRVAGVSAFGFGGTNFHVVLENDPSALPGASALERWPAELVVLRGDTPETARALASRVLNALSEGGQLRPELLANLRDVAFTLAQGAAPVQVACVAGDLVQLITQLQAVATGQAAVGVFKAGPSAGKVAFLFPGQGSQRAGAMSDLFVAFPGLRPGLEDSGLARTLLPEAAFTAEARTAQQNAVTDTRVAQPALGTLGLAMAQLLEAVGIRPDMLGGHSYGELVALAVAGALDPADLIPLSAARGRAILAAGGTDPGTMAAVGASGKRVAAVLANVPGVVLANLNAPDQTVISGTSAGVAAAVQALSDAGIVARPIPVACAFHSPVIAAAVETFGRDLEAVSFRPPSRPVYRNATASPHDADGDAIRRALAEHVAQPVLFVDEIEAMYKDGARVFIEVGPGRVLSGLVKKILKGREHTTVVTASGEANGIAELLMAFGAAIAAGVTLDPRPLFAGRRATRCSFDALPARSKTAWIVDGHRARPAIGPLPDGALKPVLTPLTLGFGAAAPTREQVVLEYLGSLQRLVDDQRDVVLRFLGSEVAEREPSPQASHAAPRSLARVAAPVVAALPVAPSASTNGQGPVVAIRLADTLLALVAERTGYPAEALDLDLDLEADLSIDSIKRLEILGALSEQLGLMDAPEAERDALLERLTAKKTLRGLITILEAEIPAPRALPAASARELPTSRAEPEVETTALAPLGASGLAEALVALVAERTGYPAEALDLDLDLEADLSIDSIKRLEILGALSERLGLDAGPEAAKDALIESLATKKTLRDIIAILTESTAAPATPAPRVELAAPPKASARAPEASAPKPAPSHTVKRFRVHDEPSRTSGKGTTLDGWRIGVTGTGGLATATVRELETRFPGASISAVTSGAPLAEAPFDAIVAVGSVTESAPAVFEGVRAHFPKRALVLAAGGGKGAGLGVAGLGKAIARELPKLGVRVVHLEESATVGSQARVLADELAILGGPVEVVRQNGSRQVRTTVSTAATRRQTPPLAPNAVVLVTGGARGITAACALALAEQAPCRLVLVGRSALPLASDEPPEAQGLEKTTDLRRALVATGRYETLKSVEVEVRRIIGAREILGNLDVLRRLGAQVEYHALDVRDAAALRGLVTDVRGRLGTINLVVHGAGILEDRRLSEKTPESFLRVYDTKVGSALTLVDAAPEAAFVFFSSISSIFGNAGQVDYAAANDALDRIAESLAAAGRKAVALAWGPWGGGGMVSPELEREYARRGMGLIAPEDGAAAFVAEISALLSGTATEARVVLMNAEPAAFISRDGPASST